MKKTLKIITFSLIVVSMFLAIVPLVKTQTNKWSEPQQLTTDPAYDLYASIMQDSSGKIWLVWHRIKNLGEPGETRDLWYKTSMDGGVSWSDEAILVPLSQKHSGGTSLLQDSTGRIWVAWTGGPKFSADIFYITSDDGGLSWSAIQQLTDYPYDDNIPSLIEVSDEVWVVFKSYGLSHNGDIWYKKTDDGGATWSEPIQLTSHPAQEFTPDAMVDSAGKIWIVWTRWMDGVMYEDIHYRTSIDNGASWSPDQQLTTHLLLETHPSIIEDISGKILIFYEYYDGVTSDIWYKTTLDGGNTWSDYQELTADAHSNEEPNTALINDEVWVILKSDRSGNMDIWMSKPSLPAVTATVNIDPDTLNLKSNGQWITAYITLPEGYRVEDIIPETVKITDIPLAWSEIQDGVFMAKFDRASVQGTLTGMPDYEEGTQFNDLTLIVAGELMNGQRFEGSDTIKVITK